ncbi:MAG: 6-pyruvoyl trahydropterin synthase family protein [Janthinobacterium lividum]
MFSLVFSRRFAMGHRLIAGLSEKCAVPHGHNEVVQVTLRAAGPGPGRLDGGANMVEPFERAKATWHRWIDGHVDHALQLSASDPLLRWFAREEPARLRRIMVTPGDPTTEVLAVCMMAKIGAMLAADGGRLACAEIRIEETPTNAVVFAGNPAAFLPVSEVALPWWRRADMSINDLGDGLEAAGA